MNDSPVKEAPGRRRSRRRSRDRRRVDDAGRRSSALASSRLRLGLSAETRGRTCTPVITAESRQYTVSRSGLAVARSRGLSAAVGARRARSSTRPRPGRSAAKAEADRNGGERRDRRERRGVAAARPSGPDRGGGWARWVRVDGYLRRSPADRRQTRGGAGEVEPAARDHRATDVDDGRPNPSFQYPASYAGVPWSYCRAVEGSAAKTAVRSEGR
jgi:hypothetical protein